MTKFSADPDAIRAMGSAVGLCLDSIPSTTIHDCDGCGSSAVAGAIDEFGVWRRVGLNETEASLSDLCSGASDAAAHYAAADGAVAHDSAAAS